MQLVTAKAISEAYSIAVKKASSANKVSLATSRRSRHRRAQELKREYKARAAGSLGEKPLGHRHVQFAPNEGNILPATKTLGLAAAQCEWSRDCEQRG